MAQAFIEFENAFISFPEMSSDNCFGYITVIIIIIVILVLTWVFPPHKCFLCGLESLTLHRLLNCGAQACSPLELVLVDSDD